MSILATGRAASGLGLVGRLRTRFRSPTRAGTGTLAANQWLRAVAAERQNVALRRLDEAARTVYGLPKDEALERITDISKDLVDAVLGLLVVYASGSRTVDSVAVSADVGIPTAALVAYAHQLPEQIAFTESRRADSLSEMLRASQMLGVPLLGPTLAQPLMAGTEVLGFIVVSRAGDRGAFDEVDDTLLHQAGQHAVTAIEKAHKESERDSLLRELSDKNEELERASELKSQFLSNMSHELRTPLSAVIGFAELILDGTDGDLTKDLRDDVGQIHESARSLLTLINDILDLSKIEAGRMDVDIERREIETIVNDVISSLRPLAEGRQLDLLADFASTSATVMCDYVRTRQIITNLVSNALKFTSQGSVTIRCEDVGEKVMISIIDTGIGIPAEAQEKIWEAFTQADGSTTRRFGGTGLGLNISRRLVELMGGEIGLVSSEGHGSCFWFTLPAAEPAADAPMRTPEEAAAMARTMILEKPPQLQRSGRVGSDDGRLPSSTRATWTGQTQDVILVVEDDPRTSTLIVRRLEEAGFETLRATTATQAIDIARRHHPAAITLDIMLDAGTDGWQVLRTLQSQPTTADIPIVIVSIVDGQTAALDMGAAGYLTKPFSKDSLLVAVREALPRMEGADVLCVDDEQPARDLLERTLRPAGLGVRLASSGEEALAAVGVKVPDAMVVDLMMPHMSGFELIARLRTRPEMSSTPIVVVSAKELTQEEVQALNDRIDRFIAKSSLKPRDLVATVRQAITHRRAS